MKEVQNKYRINTIFYMRDNRFATEDAILILHATRGTHWILFINEKFF